MYYYANDAMAGGRQSSSLSRYTLYTGYSTYLKIQPAFDKVQYSRDFNTNTVNGTGFVKWNKTTRQMEPTQPKVPNNGNVWYNNGDGQGNYLKPRLCNVPVFTLLGGYDPVNKTAVMYPAARSNLGNVFNLPAPTISATERRCWVQVDFANRPQQNIAIAHNRLGTQNIANRYNINLAQADKPTAASVYCQDAGSAPVQLGDGISIADPSSFPTMKPAVIVGKQHGYSALWQAERAEFSGMLQDLANNSVPLLNDR
ncbi:MAG: TagA domain-containing protein [Venatoribacter sp.]